MVDNIDALIIGSGAGGGALAWSLTRRGLRVLVLERGPRYARSDYMHDEIAVAEPLGFFIPRRNEDGHVVVRDGLPPERSTLGWTASCVGGGTVHMGACLYRFAPCDFQARTQFGDYEAVVDWPYSYDDLEPYYGQAEAQLGVSGASQLHPFAGPRSRAYPMEPLRSHPLVERFDEACAALGLQPFPTPRAINSVPYHGRPACRHCDFCGGFGCPTGARGSAQETLLNVAESTALAEIRDRCLVHEITVSPEGRATGCRYIDRDGSEQRVHARIVCVCCSAVESARLLLLSTSRLFPDGLGNGSGLVGRHLQFHSSSGARGRFAFARHAEKPLGDRNHFLNRSLTDYYVLPAGTLPYEKGGVLRFDFLRPQPIVRTLKRARSGPTMLWGQALKDAMREPFQDYRDVEFEVFHDFLPNDRTFVTLDPDVRDRWGLPVARITLGAVTHHERAGRWLVDRGLDVLRELGADEVSASSCGEVGHAMVQGTCRAGTDPSTSVLNEFCRSHEVPNLFVVDGSFMPTSGGAPTTLTIVANALRTADRVVDLCRAGDL
jgi:choline dehydrogenase-like flavoprotein